MGSRSATARTCPICKKELVGSDTPPFCSDRCRLIDLGNWLSDKYAVPGDDLPPPDRKDDES